MAPIDLKLESFTADAWEFHAWDIVWVASLCMRQGNAKNQSKAKERQLHDFGDFGHFCSRALRHQRRGCDGS